MGPALGPSGTLPVPACLFEQQFIFRQENTISDKV